MKQGESESAPSSDPRLGIFRRRAVERLASPDDLDDLIIVASAQSWLAIAALGLLVGAAAFWAFNGRVGITLDAQGQLAEMTSAAGSSGLGAVLWLPVAEALEVEPGMPVRLEPQGFPPTRYGYLLGQVEAVDRHPVSLGSAPPTATLEALSRPAETYLRVDVRLELDADSRARWTSSAAARPELFPSLWVDAEVEVRSERPIERLVPGWGTSP